MWHRLLPGRAKVGADPAQAQRQGRHTPDSRAVSCRRWLCCGSEQSTGPHIAGWCRHHFTSGKLFKAAAKHGLPFVAFTRPDSCFSTTAFKNRPPWDDFLKGRESDMPRMRQRFTDMLDRLHSKTMLKHSQLKTAEDDHDADEAWAEHRARDPKHPRAEPQHACVRCPACAARGW